MTISPLFIVLLTLHPCSRNASTMARMFGLSSLEAMAFVAAVIGAPWSSSRRVMERWPCITAESSDDVRSGGVREDGKFWDVQALRIVCAPLRSPVKEQISRDSLGDLFDLEESVGDIELGISREDDILISDRIRLMEGQEIDKSYPD